MKYIQLIVILVLICYSCSHAQLIRGYGIKGGVVLANQDISTGTESDKNRIGFDVGLYIELVDLPVFSALFELHYIQKGIKGETVKNNVSFNYLSFPILAKLSLQQSTVTPYLLVGPRLDVLVSKDYSPPDLTVGGETGILEPEDITFGFDIGLGMETVLKPVKLLFEFRYSPDFTYATNDDLSKRKNHSFEFLIGIGL